jgi:glycosyltransferase involved in cell wall biosynthesis
MRILQVIPHFMPAQAYGGPVAGTYNLSKYLVNKGHDVTVYTTDTLGGEGRIQCLEEELDGIKIHRFKNISNSLAFRTNIKISPGIYPKIRQEITQFDIIHMHDFRSLQNVIVYGQAVRHNTPFILQAHGSLPRIMTSRNLKTVFDELWGYQILKHANKVIALTKKYLSLPAKGIFREKWRINSEQPLILFLGRIHKIKGLDILIEGYGRLISKMPQAKLVIAGPDNGYLTNVKEKLANLGLANDVLLTGPLYGKEKISAYVDADVFVLPSIYETFPVSVIEACACGTPVIVTDRCGIANLIDEQVGLVASYDADSLSNAILNLLQDKPRREKFSKLGKSLVLDKFNWSVIGQQIEAIYFEQSHIS